MDKKFLPAAWPWLLGYLLLVSLLCRLGFWQLDRAVQKQESLEQQQQAMQAPALNINQISKQDLPRYQQVEITGQFDTEHSYLLDNQIVDAKAGYFVFTPFIYDAKQPAILVNRGWIALNQDRRQLPEIKTPATKTTLRGRINQFPQPGLKLANAEIPTSGWPAVVQVIKASVLSAHLGYDIEDYQLELAADQPDGYKRQWQLAVAIPPEKHRAYAVQWFGLSVTLTVLCIWLVFRNKRERST